ncbi:hypothetical protein BFW01_g7275 [Lasiodiplodia theobromae]|nr:hypothetical protein BFW01_g7275 [Lasiodiplodia theobromae]
MMSLDAHERPPEHIRHVYKKYQKLRGNALNDDPQLLDPRDSNAVDRLHVVRFIDPTDLRSAFQDFAAAESSDSLALPDTPVPVYEHRHMPGRPNTFDALSSHLPNLARSAYHTLPVT